MSNLYQEGFGQGSDDYRNGRAYDPGSDAPEYARGYEDGWDEARDTEE